MKKDLVIKKDTPLSIVKTKALLDLTQKILGESGADSGWAERLWAWADEHDISDEQIPRDLQRLTQLTSLYTLTRFSLYRKNFTEWPKVIGNLPHLTRLSLRSDLLNEFHPGLECLTQFTSLDLHCNHVTELPENIVNLKNLKHLTLDNVGVVFSLAQTEWIEELKSNGCMVIYISRSPIYR